MDISLDLYKIFYTVAKYNHMTKASEALHISQPAISQSIKKLEDQLGGTLFLRSNKGMELTQEGKTFFEHIKNAMEVIENAENEFENFRNLSKGEIKIGCSATLTKLVLMDSVKKFHKMYPNIKINITNDLTSNLVSDLKVGKLDFVVFNESNIQESNVSLEQIASLAQGFMYNPDFYKDNITDIQQINTLPLILQKPEANSRKLLDHILLSNGVALKPQMEVVSQDLVVEFTNAGLGVGFCIVDLAKQNAPNLLQLGINNLFPNINVFVATNKSVSPTFASKTFIEFLKHSQKKSS